MIRRKDKMASAKDRFDSFMNHYHNVVDLCFEGNSELLKKIKNCDINENYKRFYIASNIPEKYFDFEMKTIKSKMNIEGNSEEVEKIEKYIDSLDIAAKKGIGLYLCGPHGVAKTTISVIILRKAIDLKFRCFFWKSQEIVEFIKSGWRNEYRKVFFEYIIETVDFLVIDDIARMFKIDTTNSEQMFIDKIFTKRDDANLATILTSNHDLEENKEAFGDALFSNFRERLIEIGLRGRDYRDTIGKKLLEEL